MSKDSFATSLLKAKMKRGNALRVLNRAGKNVRLSSLLSKCRSHEHVADNKTLDDLWHEGAIRLTITDGRLATRLPDDWYGQCHTWVKITNKGQHLLNQLTQEIRELEDKQSKPEASRTSEVWGTW